MGTPWLKTLSNVRGFLLLYSRFLIKRVDLRWELPNLQAFQNEIWFHRTSFYLLGWEYLLQPDRRANPMELWFVFEYPVPTVAPWVHVLSSFQCSRDARNKRQSLISYEPQASSSELALIRPSFQIPHTIDGNFHTIYLHLNPTIHVQNTSSDLRVWHPQLDDSIVAIYECFIGLCISSMGSRFLFMWRWHPTSSIWYV